jgi:pimeloyl-ACP methyl ester carboxylesterase
MCIIGKIGMKEELRTMRKETIPSHEHWHDCTKSVDLHSGLRMFYMEMGRPESAPLVLVHGFSDSSRVWRSMASDLLDDFHIYALDLRGFGQSDKPEQFVYTMAEHASDVVSFMDVLKLEQVFLMGHSMGSMVAQNIAFSRPERIKGAALLATFARMHETPEQVREVYDLYYGMDIKKLSDEQLQKIFVPFPEKLSDKSFLPGYLSTLRGVGGKNLCAAWLGMSIEDNRNLLQFIKAPVLVLWGSEDTIFTKEHRDEFLSCLPNAEYKLFEGNGHEIPTEIPSLAAKAAGAFFKSI